MMTRGSSVAAQWTRASCGVLDTRACAAQNRTQDRGQDRERLRRSTERLTTPTLPALRVGLVVGGDLLGERPVPVGGDVQDDALRDLSVEVRNPVGPTYGVEAVIRVPLDRSRHQARGIARQDADCTVLDGAVLLNDPRARAV